MARCVLPVLVGPSTAVTPAPRVRRSRSAGGENEIGINGPAWRPRLHSAGRGSKGGDKCLCITTRRSKALCLRCGTSLERIAAESATRTLFEFVHREIWMHRSPQIPYGVSKPALRRHFRAPWVNLWREHDSVRSQEGSSCELRGLDVRRCVPCVHLKSDIVASRVAGASKSPREYGLHHCVLASARGGSATETNCLASSTPGPSGVGMAKRNGTSTRVPAIGASQTSASRNSIRYLIAARSGT
jgi:hypothetical protein